jgi:hypothetical protein
MGVETVAYFGAVETGRADDPWAGIVLNRFERIFENA